MGRHRKQKHSQKIYKMKGCNRTCRRGGDVPLAYPSANVPKVPNPFLAYSGKGGKSCGISPQPSNLAYTNTNAANPLVPSTGPEASGFNFLNSQVMRGGCGPTCLKGGSTCNSCNLFGGMNHREGCKCSQCRGGNMNMNMNMTGGSTTTQSNNGIPYPNGTVGTSWTPTSWPASKGLLPGDANHFSLNTYNNDVPLQMKAEGAAPPFSVGGGKRRKMRKSKQKASKQKAITKRRQRGGTLSNFIGQDFVNLGRQLQFGLGSAYNGLNGYHQPTNPMPWKGQLPSTANLTTLQKAF